MPAPTLDLANPRSQEPSRLSPTAGSGRPDEDFKLEATNVIAQQPAQIVPDALTAKNSGPWVFKAVNVPITNMPPSDMAMALELIEVERQQYLCEPALRLQPEAGAAQCSPPVASRIPRKQFAVEIPIAANAQAGFAARDQYLSAAHPKRWQRRFRSTSPRSATTRFCAPEDVTPTASAATNAALPSPAQPQGEITVHPSEQSQVLPAASPCAPAARRRSAIPLEPRRTTSSNSPSSPPRRRSSANSLARTRKARWPGSWITG